MSNQASGALDIGLPKQSYSGENIGHVTSLITQPKTDSHVQIS